MATTAFDYCGFSPEYLLDEWFFPSSIGDNCDWQIGTNEDGTLYVTHDDPAITKNAKHETSNFHTIKEAVQWCRIKELEHELKKLAEKAAAILDCEEIKQL